MAFGDIHWHCEISSDGQRPLTEALHTAREELRLDFAGPADHIGPDGRFSWGWGPEHQVDILRDFDQPGRFAVLPGAEFSARVGHANFYCDSLETYRAVCERLPAASDRCPYAEEAEYPWPLLVDALEPGHTLLVPHHTNTNSFVGAGVVRPETGRPFWSSMTFPRGVEMKHMRGFEIYQNRGCFEAEAPDPDWRIRFGGYGASARTALAAGYRFGFTGGTDNHNGWPSRTTAGGHIDGLTALLVDGDLTTANVWRALYERRAYATTGARIICDVTFDGAPLGSLLTLPWEAQPEMRIRIYGTAPLERVEIVSAGEVLARLPVDGRSWDLDTTWADERPGRPLHNVYYYLRIRQADGHCAWLSPFWRDVEHK